MKKLILILSVFIITTNLKAEIFGSAGTIKPGIIMFGVEPQADIDPSDAMGFFHFGVGLIKRMDLDLKLGLGTASTYFGGDLEYQFIKSKILDFSLSLGTHYQNAAFMDFTPTFTHRFEGWALSTGPDFNWQVSRATYLSASWFVGTSIAISDHVEALFDVGVKLRGNNNWVSGGIATYF